MASCSTCGAPLRPHRGTCDYCGAHNDVDLRGVHEFTVNRPESNRVCPDCDVPLETLDLQVEGNFYIERCPACLGLFFDPGELEALIDKSVSNVFRIDRLRIDALVREESEKERRIVYRKCPVCRELMHRIGFGHRSGVILDQCKTHGFWLDSGELKRLMDWKKAGGQLLHEQVRLSREEEEKRKARLRASLEAGSGEESEGFLRPFPAGTEKDLIQTLVGVFGRLFR
jgi:Zn-finger nucleic acid-binding protein